MYDASDFTLGAILGQRKEKSLMSFTMQAKLLISLKSITTPLKKNCLP